MNGLPVERGGEEIEEQGGRVMVSRDSTSWGSKDRVLESERVASIERGGGRTSVFIIHVFTIHGLIDGMYACCDLSGHNFHKHVLFSVGLTDYFP